MLSLWPLASEHIEALQDTKIILPQINVTGLYKGILNIKCSIRAQNYFLTLCLSALSDKYVFNYCTGVS